MPLIVTTFPAHAPVTPVGKPVTVARCSCSAYVIIVIAVLIQLSVHRFQLLRSGLPYCSMLRLSSRGCYRSTTACQAYRIINIPGTVGVPLIVTTFPAQAPVTPVGKPVTVAPVAPVVAYVIFVIAVLIQLVCASGSCQSL